jgi:uncharacterized protein (DUF58 family)
MTNRSAVRQRWRAWVAAWWAARLPRQDTVTLTHRNLYILPTRAGWAFIVVVLVLLLASINEQLNLGYALTFLLGGSALVGLHQTHANLHGLQWQWHPPTRVHAGAALSLQLQVHNPHRRRHRFGLTARWDDQHAVALEVPAGATLRCELDIPTTARGPLHIERLTLETRYPLGLFRAWGYWRPASTVLVWPALDPHAPPLPGHTGDGDLPDSPTASLGRQGQLDGLRSYQRGDPMKWVAWKKSTHTLAAGAGLVAREPTRHHSPDVWLDLEHSPGLGSLPMEARLSRLATWLLQAEADHGEGGAEYGLILGAHRIAPAHGPAHLRHCLDALACWPQAPGGAA